MRAQRLACSERLCAIKESYILNPHAALNLLRDPEGVVPYYLDLGSPGEESHHPTSRLWCGGARAGAGAQRGVLVKLPRVEAAGMRLRRQAV